MHCRKQEASKVDLLSDHDIQITDNYLKRLEEK